MFFLRQEIQLNSAQGLHSKSNALTLEQRQSFDWENYNLGSTYYLKQAPRMRLMIYVVVMSSIFLRWQPGFIAKTFCTLLTKSTLRTSTISLSAVYKNPDLEHPRCKTTLLYKDARLNVVCFIYSVISHIVGLLGV